MDFNKSVVTTSRGAVVSVHASSAQVTTNLFYNGWYIIPEGNECNRLCREFCRRSPTDDASQVMYLTNIRAEQAKLTVPLVRYTRAGTSVPVPHTVSVEPAPTVVADATAPGATPDRKKFCTDLLKFFTEFTYVPSARFTNTLCRQENVNGIAEYIRDYFTLFDHPMVNQICDKLKSPEWNEIAKAALTMAPTKVINQRLTILYGPPGTGKTTAAMMEYPAAQVFACASDMTTSDLFRAFNFDPATGKTEFLPTPIVVAMKTGVPVILDELGLLPIDTLRAFQAVLDNKPKVTLPTGEEINIKEGFMVIATMNNTVNGQTISLPEPIVDRAGEIIYVKSSATLLSGCAFNFRIR